MAAIQTRTNSHHIPSLLTPINTLLQTVTPQNTTPLNQFSQNLSPSLVLQVLKSQTNPQTALTFFTWSSNPTPNPNNYSHTPLIYTAITDLLLSHNLFSTAAAILHSSNHLTDFLVGKIIKACGDVGDIRGAMYWLDRAKARFNGNCLYSYNSVLGVLVRANRVDLGKAVFDQVVGEGVVVPDVSTYTVLIRGFCKVGRVEEAGRVFEEMVGRKCRRNLITYNTFIAGLCRKGFMEKAREILDGMGKECLPDMVTFTTLMDGYCKRNEVDEAVKCWEEMVRRGLEPNVLTYNVLIYGFCMSGRVDEAREMMKNMRLNGLKDNVATHTCLLKGLCIVGRSEEAVNHLKEMVNMGLKPDAKAYAVVVNEHCKMRRPSHAIALLDEMKWRGLSPMVSNFNALFRVLCDMGQHDRGIRYLKKMSKRGCVLNFVSYSTLICSLCSVRGRMKDVEELVVEMIQKGHQPDVVMYNTMIRGYCEDGDVHMAIGICREMMEKGFAINLQSFLVFVKELCGKGKATELNKLFEEMCKRCPVSNMDSYKRILDETLCRLREDLPESVKDQRLEVRLPMSVMES